MGLTDSSGNEVNAYDYDPYGVFLHETTGVTNPWHYAGDYFESSTGLVKFGTRYYNPALGRWTQQDPVKGECYVKSLWLLHCCSRFFCGLDDIHCFWREPVCVGMAPIWRDVPFLSHFSVAFFSASKKKISRE